MEQSLNTPLSLSKAFFYLQMPPFYPFKLFISPKNSLPLYLQLLKSLDSHDHTPQVY